MIQLGKRYKCEICGTTVLCVKGGEGDVVCCEQTVQVMQMEELPSGD